MSTILHRLAAWSDSDPHSTAQRYKKGKVWKTISAREFCDRVYWLALFLESRGVTPQDVGTIFSTNCPEWVHLDLAVLLLGGKSAGIYPNSTPKDVRYVLEHTETRLLCVQNKEFYKKAIGPDEGAALPERIQWVLVFDGDTSFAPCTISYESALREGRKLADKKGVRKLTDYLGRLDPLAGAFMIYTSGTTGKPKGAILSHDNLVYTVDVAAKYWGLKVGVGSLFSFLPLCHIAEKIQNLGAGITLRYPVSFCTAFDNVSKELPEVQPRLLLCVPRLWEKMMEGVLAKIEKTQGSKKWLAQWALKTGAKVSEARFNGKSPSVVDQIQWKIADRLVVSKIRDALGLGHAQVLASGAAALPSHVCRWFRSLGLDIMEDYGQTESTGVICLSVKGMDCAGTVGKPVPGIEVRIAEDGEILTKGRHVFKGYFKDEAATRQVLEAGWLHTGDLGEVTPQGLIRIKGRKKEILKTSGGKMVAPLPIEESLKAFPVISQVCMVGDGRKYLSALITLSEAKLVEVQTQNDSCHGLLVTLPGVVQEVRQAVERVNASLASYEQIKKFAVLNREFSIADGEMTPTLKMKRSVIESRYSDVIQRFYETG